MGSVGGKAGEAIGSYFGAGNTPKTAQPFDPYAGGHMAPQNEALEGYLGGKLKSSAWSGASAPSPAWNPYAAPRPEQTKAIADLQNYQRQAEPLYGHSTAYLDDTVRGKYLDVYARPEFQKLADARQSVARQLFQDAQAQIEAGSAAKGNYNSSARVGQTTREGGRIGTQAAQDIAQAGWTQYGAERGLQQQAAGMGAQLAPSLAGQVFGAGEQLRSAEQAGSTAQLNAESQREIATMEGQLRAQGLDEVSIQNALEYMKMRALRQQGGSYQPQGPGIGGIGNLLTSALKGMGPSSVSGAGGGVPMNAGTIGVGSGDVY